MGKSTDNKYSYIILIIIISGFSLYFYNESNKEIIAENITSLKCVVTHIEPNYAEYRNTDNITFGLKEYPDKNFELNYLYVDLEEGEKILKHIESTKNIIVDIEKEEILKKGIFGIKPKIRVLGIRKLNSESISYEKYTIEKKSSNLAYFYFALFGIGILIIKLIITKRKNTVTNSS